MKFIAFIAQSRPKLGREWILIQSFISKGTFFSLFCKDFGLKNLRCVLGPDGLKDLFDMVFGCHLKQVLAFNVKNKNSH